MGLYDPEAKSLVVAHNGILTTYGNPVARERLLARLHQWVDLGMPNMSAMHLRIYPATTEVWVKPNEWIVRRKHSSFLWSLRGWADEEISPSTIGGRSVRC